MGIVDEDIVALRDATDIVAVITRYTQLRRSGQRWVGLCPFHGEKTPSFNVNQELGLYRCWGCQVRGDVITFVREMEHLDFVGAVELLAGWAGMTLRYSDKDEGESRRRRHRLVAAMEQAVDWYHERLLSAPDAAVARKYLRERGLERRRGARLPHRLGAGGLGRAGQGPPPPERRGARHGPRLPQPQRSPDRCVPRSDPVPDLRRQRRRGRLRRAGDARWRRPEVPQHAGDLAVPEVEAAVRPELVEGSDRER